MESISENLSYNVVLLLRWVTRSSIGSQKFISVHSDDLAPRDASVCWQDAFVSSPPMPYEQLWSAAAYKINVVSPNYRTNIEAAADPDLHAILLQSFSYRSRLTVRISRHPMYL